MKIEEHRCFAASFRNMLHSVLMSAPLCTDECVAINSDQADADIFNAPVRFLDSPLNVLCPFGDSEFKVPMKLLSSWHRQYSVRVL